MPIDQNLIMKIFRKEPDKVEEMREPKLEGEALRAKQQFEINEALVILEEIKKEGSIRQYGINELLEDVRLSLERVPGFANYAMYHVIKGDYSSQEQYLKHARLKELRRSREAQ